MLPLWIAQHCIESQHSVTYHCRLVFIRWSSLLVRIWFLFILQPNVYKFCCRLSSQISVNNDDSSSTSIATANTMLLMVVAWMGRHQSPVTPASHHNAQKHNLMCTRSWGARSMCNLSVGTRVPVPKTQLQCNARRIGGHSRFIVANIISLRSKVLRSFIMFKSVL